jgi:peptidoglycan/LPS O-acetylase OafA/YrhL
LVAESFDWGKTWQGNIALALPLTFLLAYFSWRFVEAPSLRARGAMLGMLAPLQTRIRDLSLAFGRSPWVRLFERAAMDRGALGRRSAGRNARLRLFPARAQVRARHPDAPQQPPH